MLSFDHASLRADRIKPVIGNVMKVVMGFELLFRFRGIVALEELAQIQYPKSSVDKEKAKDCQSEH